MKYNLYIGRWQPPHFGHMYIFEQSLKEGQPVLIAIRDIEPDEKNPLQPTIVKELWQKIYKDNDLVKVIIIPDIASVRYGRDVGYKIEEITPPTQIAGISATSIRKNIQENSNEWKNNVHESIHDDLLKLLSK